MDPNAWLAEMRDLIRSRDPKDRALMREKLDEMEAWLEAGGFLPRKEA